MGSTSLYLVFLVMLIPVVIAGKIKDRTKQAPGLKEVPFTHGAPIKKTSGKTKSAIPPPPMHWPTERYSLVRVGEDCPHETYFRKAAIYQDSEDFCSINEWTTAGFEGPMKLDGYRITYCSKSTKSIGVGYWPAGDYCIHRYGTTCPTGFEEGAIFWDDENDENANRRSGRLPAGIYDEDTLQYFCCRNDSLASDPISLPNRKPFYLYRYTSHCQLVYGMQVFEESIFFDDEDDDNTNYNSGSFPKDSGLVGDHRLHYCRYHPHLVV